eukprot:m.144421 g.144421  ORF g.144421 m.144421 type:complete len:445 (-) comp30370_c0_seq1:61-1395(-)
MLRASKYWKPVGFSLLLALGVLHFMFLGFENEQGLKKSTPAPLSTEEQALRNSVRFAGAETERRLRAKTRIMSQRTEFTVVTFGGSISAFGWYTTFVARWLREMYPHLTIRTENLALGATGGDIPSYCMFKMFKQRHITSVDLVFTEFSINPTDDEAANRLYSRIAGLPGEPAHIVVDLFNGISNPVHLWNARPSPETFGVRVAEAMNITVLSAAYFMAPLWDTDSNFTNFTDVNFTDANFTKEQLFLGDNYHPNEKLHTWIAYIITSYFSTTAVLTSLPGNSSFLPTIGPAPITLEEPLPGYCDTHWVIDTGPSFTPEESDGFRSDRAEGNEYKRYYATNTSTRDAIGASITFSVTPGSTCQLSVGYMLSGKYELGSADVYVDGINRTRITPNVKVPYSIQVTQPIPGEALQKNTMYKVKIVNAAYTLSSPPGYRWIVTGLYC